jgi:hypothetical protein
MVPHDLDLTYFSQGRLQALADLALDLIFEVLGEDAMIPEIEDDLHLIRLGTRFTAKAQGTQRGKQKEVK